MQEVRMQEPLFVLTLAFRTRKQCTRLIDALTEQVTPSVENMWFEQDKE
jgi:hypothetical protein